MTPLLFILMLIVLQTPSSKPQPKISPELLRLREEFIRATNEYKLSLVKLKTFYEQDVERTEQKLEVSRKLRAENLVSESLVEHYETELARAQAKLADTTKQLTNADEEIKALDDGKLSSDYKHAVTQRRKERKPRCANWTLTAYRRETAKSIEVGFRFVCR